MKKTVVFVMLFLAGVCFFAVLPGCGGGEEKAMRELAVGNWIQSRNRAYILLVTNSRGEWNSSVRITDATSKIVKAKGSAKGTWHIEKRQMIFTVSESDISEIWEPNSNLFFDIMELDATSLILKDEFGRALVWNKTNRQSSARNEESANQIIPMGPIAVNLNKNRSNDKDRYLCLNMNMEIKELMPQEAIPSIHPRVREAAMIFLSSLVFDNVKDFDRVKDQIQDLVKVINPYMGGVVKDVSVEHVIVASEIEKVEEFFIEHTLTQNPAAEEETQGKKGKDSKEKS